MPIRSVTIDWGDGGKTGGQSLGKYQNHKPRCQRTAGELLGECKKGNTLYSGYACFNASDCEHLGSGAICERTATSLDDNRFGDTVAACKEGYFNYKHTYMCHTIFGVQECLTPTDVNCQTKVPGRGDQRGCRFKPAVQIKDNWGWCNADHDKSGVKVGAEGYYDASDQTSGQNGCLNNNAKEYYDGYIYVIP